MIEEVHIPLISKIRIAIKSASTYEVFAIIYNFDRKGKTIYFSNAYLGKMLGKGERQISKIISNLKTLGFIKRIMTRGGRIIEVVQSKIDAIMGRHYVPTPTNKSSSDPTNKSSNNNIVNNNIVKKSKFSPSILKKYFVYLLGKNEKKVDIDLITRKFYNSHLSEGNPAKNRRIWKGLAHNYVLSWISNINSQLTVKEPTNPYKALLERSKKANTITINGNTIKTSDGYYISSTDGKQYEVYALLKNWYDKGGYEVEIDGQKLEK